MAAFCLLNEGQSFRPRSRKRIREKAGLSLTVADLSVNVRNSGEEESALNERCYRRKEMRIRKEGT
jgi:hypothetical protein